MKMCFKNCLKKCKKGVLHITQKDNSKKDTFHSDLYIEKDKLYSRFIVETTYMKVLLLCDIFQSIICTRQWQGYKCG
jgi:hypothetical protein